MQHGRAGFADNFRVFVSKKRLPRAYPHFLQAFWRLQEAGQLKFGTYNLFIIE